MIPAGYERKGEETFKRARVNPTPPTSAVHGGRMNGKWSRNSFLLSSSSLANPWLTQLRCFVYYLPTKQVVSG